MATAKTRIKHNGKTWNSGDKVSKSDFGDAYARLVEVGSIDESDGGEANRASQPTVSEPTVSELRAQAKELGVEGADKMKKDELAQAISQAGTD